jgi:tryptophan 2-monooxygenase
VIPNMDVFGGWGGFLGVHAPDARDSLAVGELRRRTQRFPDTWAVDHASFLRSPGGNDTGPLLRRQDQSKALQGTVALIGGRIANLIAAYELSRCGVAVTMFEQRAGDSTSTTNPFGGRLWTDVRHGVVAELGAKAFPSSSPVFWHYVWRAAVSNGYTEDQADLLRAQRFPSPGVVPTRVCYQDEWFDLTPDLTKLRPIVQEAAYLVRAWLLGLNDGVADPKTVYLGEAMELARHPRNTQPRLLSFWTEMRRRYDGRSFESVLATEVFASGSNPVNLQAAFAAVGVGTGGFGPVYDIACLEVLRQVVWDYGSLYALPELQPGAGSDDAVGVLGSRAEAFARYLANAALEESRVFFKNRSFDDMFRFATSVNALCVVGQGQQTKIGICLAGKNPIPFDLAIVAISSRAMQTLGLGHDSPKNPFRTSSPQTVTSGKAVESVQAAVHQLNMISSYKLFARITKPEYVAGWPTNTAGQPIRCFVTDRYPRTTYVMPPPSPSRDDYTMAVAAEVWGPDALKLQNADAETRLGWIAGTFFDPPDPKTSPYHAVGKELQRTMDLRGRDWNRQVGVGGGVKLDRPGDDYFAGSLYYQSQLAMEPGSVLQPWGRTFLAGDSVGYLGGWAEGAAMSALTATTAVLYQIRALNPEEGAVLWSQQLIDPNTPKNHQWTTISTRVSPLPKWKSITAVAPCPNPPGVPPTWRWDQVDFDDRLLEQPAISQSGRWMVCTVLGVPHWRSYDQNKRQWGQWIRFKSAEPMGNMAISAGPPNPRQLPGLAQVVAIKPDGTLQHCMWRDGFNQWNLVRDEVGAEAAIAVTTLGEDWPESAHVITLRAPDSALLHAIRKTDGTWTPFNTPPGPPGHAAMNADKLAIAAAPDSEFVMIVVIDKEGTVQAIGRKTNGSWTPWETVAPPAEGLKAQLVSAVGISGVIPISSERAQVVAKFSDGNLYYRLVDVLGLRAEHPWIRLPYPATAAYDTNCLTLGASVDVCETLGSATVWMTSQPKAGTDQVKEQGS